MGATFPNGDGRVINRIGYRRVAGIVNPGTGYSVGDLLTVTGGVLAGGLGAMQLLVLAINPGTVPSVKVLNPGNYTTQPTNPVSVTGGTGTGATFNLSAAPASITDAQGNISTGKLDDSEPDGLQIDFPEEEASWLAWECVPKRIVDYRRILHLPLAGTVTEDVPSIDPMVTPDYANSPTAGWSSSVDAIVQQTSAPKMKLVLKGYGVRVGQRVNPPKLISYGGQPVFLQHEDVSESEQGISVDVSMYRTDWVLTYLIRNAPDSIPIMANPLLGTDGTP